MAKLDADGVFRAVIAQRDPGVANWLDTAGHSEGSMIYRWNQADSAPIPAARKVKLSQLSGALPPGTARVSPAERAREIEIRHTHVRRRLARSPQLAQPPASFTLKPRASSAATILSR